MLEKLSWKIGKLGGWNIGMQERWKVETWKVGNFGSWKVRPPKKLKSWKVRLHKVGKLESEA